MIKNIFLSYQKEIVFDDLNIDFAEGKISCLLGPSGTGKSTLLKIIAGIIPGGNAGEIFRGDISVNFTQIAYMAQTDLLQPWFNAWDNALLGHRLRGAVSPALRLAAQELFIKTGLQGAEKKFPDQLSGGMRQRVALVRTFLEDKPIILMDEPFSAVDAITRFQLQALAVELLKNRTVIFVTHDPLEALRLANDIYILSGQPATCMKVIELKSPPLRDLDHPELMAHQADLYRALVGTKEKLPTDSVGNSVINL
ncbi:MAG TPA: ABC transporter ATP-binding protein [Gammaproteobacteria bacterium]|nr:ABC transporter ATP-binding protein [Gammaproteobacteria bacterium]